MIDFQLELALPVSVRPFYEKFILSICKEIVLCGVCSVSSIIKFCIAWVKTTRMNVTLVFTIYISNDC